MPYFISTVLDYKDLIIKRTYHKFGEIDSLHCALVFFTNNNMCQIYHFWQPCMSYLPCQSVSMPNAKCRLLGSHHAAARTNTQVLHTQALSSCSTTKRRVGLIAKRTRILLQVSFLESKSTRSQGF